MIELYLHKELQAAERIVHQAAILTKTVLSSVQAVAKEDASPVTVADFAAQALMIALLRKEFPDDGFVGEEDAAALRADPTLRRRVHELVLASGYAASEAEVLECIDLGGRGAGGPRGRFWVMDPVDGTATFLRNEQYAVALALVQDGREMLGVVCCPNLRLDEDRDGRIRETAVDGAGLGVMLSAVRGQGAALRVLPDTGAEAPLPPPQPLPQLSPPGQMADVHVVDNLASRSAVPGLARRLMQRVGAAYPGTDVWSSHVRYAALVLGGGHVLLRVPEREARSYIWDHAGAQLIFTELGGKVTDLEGREMDFGRGRALDGNWGLVAAVGEIHGTVLALVRELMEEQST